MTTLAASVAVACVLVFAASAHAQAYEVPIDQETQADFAVAAAYWNASPTGCRLVGVQVIFDESKVEPYAELAEVGGCRIWIGDYFLQQTRARRCAIRVHAWGHLTGHHDGLGAPDDPLGVMGSDAMPASCAAMDPAPVPVVAPTTPSSPADGPAPALAAEWAAYDTAYVRWAERKRARTRCTDNANVRRRRAARVTARRDCARRFVIRRAPARPLTPNPNGVVG